MNFFGHAVVARLLGQQRDAAADAERAPYALGAMLPDFASMCGGRLERAVEPSVAAGIELHHRTDAVFHHHPLVLALMAELHERLHRDGCARGPARAGSHIGVELLLDGVLLEDTASQVLYIEALAHPPQGVLWREPADVERFAWLRRRLRQAGVPDDLREPSAVAQRLVRVLSRRPRLAPAPGDAVILERALAAMAPRVERLADQILGAVIEGLGEGLREGLGEGLRATPP